MWNGDALKKILYYSLLLLLMGVFGYSGFRLYGIDREYKAGKEAYEKLQSFARFPDGEGNQESGNTVRMQDSPREQGLGEAKENSVPPYPVIDFSALEALNEEVMGWIYLEGSAINYPVVKGKDNEYYLDHLFDGKYNHAGSIFMDYRNRMDLSDGHTIIYGHHMKNGSMFAGLSNYMRQEYYEAHPRGVLVTKEGAYAILFFAGYVTDTGSDSWDLDWADAAAKEAWIASALQRSAFRSVNSLRNIAGKCAAVGGDPAQSSVCGPKTTST